MQHIILADEDSGIHILISMMWHVFSLGDVSEATLSQMQHFQALELTVRASGSKHMSFQDLGRSVHGTHVTCTNAPSCGVAAMFTFE